MAYGTRGSSLWGRRFGAGAICFQGRKMGQKGTCGIPFGALAQAILCVEPMGIAAYQLAKALHLPGIYEIVREHLRAGP